mgnify:CR=1 FL=1
MDGANVAVEYTYDANGNLKKDYNKKIVNIAYNSLNLPDGLQFTNGNTTNYVYDAAGQKLSVTHLTAIAGVVIPMTSVMTPLAPAQISTTFKTDYCGNVIYENGAVSKILTEEGYIMLAGTTPTYHYYLKDHQGNNRVVINQSGTVEQVNHYYPFGGLMGESTAGGVQPYKYNGKELDRMHGLDLFDYGARHYDAAIGRWHTVDPLAEKYYSISPYAYCGNNPIRFIDPNGMFYDDFVVNHDKNHIDRIKTTDKTDRIFDGTNPKGTIVEKGEFNVEEYKSRGYSVNTVVASGMAITDLGLSILGGEMAFAKIGVWIGKGVSALRASRAAKVAEAGEEVGMNAAKGGLSNAQLVSRAATKAEAAIGGTGRFAGTAKHTYANNLLSRYQSIYGNRGLQFNHYFNNGVGNRGFLDVVDHGSRTIFDYKFGNAVMGSGQYLKYSRNFPGYSIQIIRP